MILVICIVFMLVKNEKEILLWCNQSGKRCSSSPEEETEASKHSWYDKYLDKMRKKHADNRYSEEQLRSCYTNEKALFFPFGR